MDIIPLGFNSLNIEFKDMNSGNMNQRSFAEVILIERTNSASIQICYVLKNDRVFNDCSENFHDVYQFDKEDFLVIGEVLTLDKQKKYITLKDGNTISYNYLIIAMGSHYSLIKSNGISTLLDAIRVRKKIPAAFAKLTKNSTAPIKKKTSANAKNDKKFPSEKICDLQNKGIDSLSDPNKRLYEVQI